MSYNPKNPNGQATSANSDPVVIASDQSAVPISATSLPLPTGAATSADQTNGSQKTQIVDGSGNVVSSTSNALNVNVTGGSVSGTTNVTQVGGSNISLGQTTMNDSLPVTLASNDTNTAPFVTSGGGGYVRQDSTGTIAKESGGNLATLAGAVSSSKMNVNVASGGLSLAPATSGGLSTATATALSNTAVAVKTTAGQVYGWYIYNPNASVIFVQFYNTTTGSTIVGTNVLNPIGIPPGGASNIVAAFGIAFSTAISVAACTTAGGTTAPTTALVANIYYD
jgi:hypothetical protein